MLNHPWQLVGLCCSALAAGAVNSLAGGGTLLTFPALLAALSTVPGTNAVWANATSTVALVPGSLGGAWGYRRQIRGMRPWLLLLIAPSFVGGMIGSLLVARMDPRIFARLIPWLLLAAASLFLKECLWPSRRGARLPGEKLTASRAGLLVVFQLGVAIYGGYFGAGIGILMLSVLSLMRLGDIHQLNALKTLLACAINGVSVAIFIVEQKVYWPFVLPMAVAAIIGGYGGAHLGLRIQPRYVRWVVVAIGFGLALHYFVHGLGPAA